MTKSRPLRDTSPVKTPRTMTRPDLRTALTAWPMVSASPPTVSKTTSGPVFAGPGHEVGFGDGLDAEVGGGAALVLVARANGDAGAAVAGEEGGEQADGPGADDEDAAIDLQPCHIHRPHADGERLGEGGGEGRDGGVDGVDGVGWGVDELAHAAGDAGADERAFVAEMPLARDAEVADAAAGGGPRRRRGRRLGRRDHRGPCRRLRGPECRQAGWGESGGRSGGRSRRCRRRRPSSGRGRARAGRAQPRRVRCRRRST